MNKREEYLRSEIACLQDKQKIFWTQKRADTITQKWREIEAISREKTGE